MRFLHKLSNNFLRTARPVQLGHRALMFQQMNENPEQNKHAFEVSPLVEENSWVIPPALRLIKVRVYDRSDSD
ncbi:hypothetical protein RS86_00526 [Microbacterium azadirachtae]|uniref:Uncharacterized protein n=1 Tax=Microbacterium azadirachtae TaxID=582680 RepID=A0A0F0LPQ4_9MICO|nr:hypothetical protein RS86_00526 [Microbacterium azadirachtae]